MIYFQRYFPIISRIALEFGRFEVDAIKSMLRQLSLTANFLIRCFETFLFVQTFIFS